MIITSFPVILGLLFGGDYLSSKKKERFLIRSAKSVVNEHSNKADKLANYNYTLEWVKETQDILYILSKTDKHFPNISLIVKDSINDSQVYLEFGQYYEYISETDTVVPMKKSYITETTEPERQYLNKVFNEKLPEIRFSAYDGNYELFYPYIKNNKVIVLYFSDYRRYGKIGS